jgi:hypothetical protein
MSKMSELDYEQRMAAEPKFAETYCSQCGQNLGPGDSGVSHCRDHMRLDQPRPSLREALRESNLVCLSNTHQKLDTALTERMTFNHWWNEGEVSPGDNPYTHETAAYWAWEGWQAGAKAEREACAKVVENYCGAWDNQGFALSQAIRARGHE